MGTVGDAVRLFLILALLVGRPYHVETVASMALSRSTHVEVTGLVTLVRKEADGDWHFRLSDQAGRFVVCEIVPSLTGIPTVVGYVQLVPPRRGQRVTVRGIRRYDTWHKWFEVHPVESWTPQ